METESRDGLEALRKPDAVYRSDPLTATEQGQY